MYNNEPSVPEKCRLCENMLITRASVIIRHYKRPVGTCKLNHHVAVSNEDRGLYELCENVLKFSQIDNNYKCIKQNNYENHHTR